MKRSVHPSGQNRRKSSCECIFDNMALYLSADLTQNWTCSGQFFGDFAQQVATVHSLLNIAHTYHFIAIMTPIGLSHYLHVAMVW